MTRCRHEASWAEESVVTGVVSDRTSLTIMSADVLLQTSTAWSLVGSGIFFTCQSQGTNGFIGVVGADGVVVADGGDVIVNDVWRGFVNISGEVDDVVFGCRVCSTLHWSVSDPVVFCLRLKPVSTQR